MKIISSGQLITDKTDETDNNQFLRWVFRAGVSETRPITVSFHGDPTKVSRRVWNGQPWRPQNTALSAGHNNYFTLAAFRPDETGRYRRQKKQFAAVHAIMLDDIGTKVSAERIILSPSWRIETSPGNFQVGYILADPITDGALADSLMDAVVKARLCDPGAKSPTSRFARLPVAVNGKHNPAFPCRLTVWNPNLRYSVEEIIDGLALDFRSKGGNKGEKPKNDYQARRDIQHDDIIISRPKENTVIAALSLRGLYKTPLGSSKHDITCPWVSEHTGAVDSGTAYFEPTDNWPIGGFKCLHGHCTNRNIRELLQYLGIEANAARMKPTIRVIAGEIHRVVDAAEQELASTGRHYQRGGLIVTIVTDPSTKETRVQESNQSTLVQVLAGVAIWERMDGRGKDWVRIDPPPRHVSVLYDAPAYAHLPPLKGLARQPYLRDDDTVVMTPGYDPVSSMFGIFAEQDFSVPEAPTKDQAIEAVEKLFNLLEEFQFATEADLSAALLAMLTAAVRPRLPHAPMIHVRAHQSGSGKSFLCKLIAIFATPQHGTPSTFPKDDEECRKLLLAELLRSPAVIEFDNLTGDLVAHKSLCIALTSEHMTDRILGISKTATVSTRTLFLSSGNNVGPVQDMTRRCITIHLDPECETPATRKFKRPGLIQEVQQKRGEYISAALTIIRAWIAAGRPRTACSSLAGYNDWSDLCRQPLLWLGCPDPVQSVFEAMADDPDRDTLGQLLKVWHACFGKKPTMVREAINFHSSSDEGHQLSELLQDIAGERGIVNRRMLGRWIKRNSGRIVYGLRFMRASGSRSAEAWFVESV